MTAITKERVEELKEWCQENRDSALAMAQIQLTSANQMKAKNVAERFADLLAIIDDYEKQKVKAGGGE